MSNCGCNAAICGGARGPVRCPCPCHRELPAEIRSAPESVRWTLSAAIERDANGRRTFIQFGRQVGQQLTAHALNDRVNLLALVSRMRQYLYHLPHVCTMEPRTCTGEGGFTPCTCGLEQLRQELDR